MWGAYFCMGAYKRDVVVVIKMGACIHGVLILCGCLLSQFYHKCYKNPTILCMISFATYYHFTSCNEAHTSATTW